MLYIFVIYFLSLDLFLFFFFRILCLLYFSFFNSFMSLLFLSMLSSDCTLFNIDEFVVGLDTILNFLDWSFVVLVVSPFVAVVVNVPCFAVSFVELGFYSVFHHIYFEIFCVLFHLYIHHLYNRASLSVHYLLCYCFGIHGDFLVFHILVSYFVFWMIESAAWLISTVVTKSTFLIFVSIF